MQKDLSLQNKQLNNRYYATFFVGYPYFFPHFLPVSRELEKRGKKVLYILSSKQKNAIIQNIAEKEGLDYIAGEDKLFDIDSEFFFLSNTFFESERIRGKTVFMDHGVGTKHCDYTNALKLNDVILVEGDYRFHKLQEAFPEYMHKVRKVGFSKLDLVANMTDRQIGDIFAGYGLDKHRQTILYAPTYFPASIEKMANNFPEDFKDCNVIVKPHYLTFERSRYRGQRRKIKKWKKFDNCKIVDVNEYSLVPFLTMADVMISDESSAIFEFAALNKPVILNRFLKLRMSYYLNPNKLLKRMDEGIDLYRKIGANADSYGHMVSLVKQELADPTLFEQNRKQFTKEICGVVDGRVSKRIADTLENC